MPLWCHSKAAPQPHGAEIAQTSFGVSLAHAETFRPWRGVHPCKEFNRLMHALNENTVKRAVETLRCVSTSPRAATGEELLHVQGVGWPLSEA